MSRWGRRASEQGSPRGQLASKTDVPAAKLTTIKQVNAETLRSGRPATIRQSGRSQVLVLREHLTPLFRLE